MKITDLLLGKALPTWMERAERVGIATGVAIFGLDALVRAYQITATVPGQPGYQSVLSPIVAAVVGRGIFYYLTIGSVLTVLALSANTAFADFPRLCRAIAQDGYLPNFFRIRGRRLVHTESVGVLAVIAGLLLILFRGVTDRSIPLYGLARFWLSRFRKQAW